LYHLAELAETALPPRLRRTLARLEYVAFLGAQQLFPDLSTADAREVERALRAAMAALVAAKRPR